jgi:hypothetical protein
MSAETAMKLTIIFDDELRMVSRLLREAKEFSAANKVDENSPEEIRKAMADKYRDVLRAVDVALYNVDAAEHVMLLNRHVVVDTIIEAAKHAHGH